MSGFCYILGLVLFILSGSCRVAVKPAEQSQETIRRDWGYDLRLVLYDEKGAPTYYLNRQALESHSYKDISANEKIAEAVRCCLGQQAVELPPIVLLNDVKGYFAFIEYLRDSGRPHLILISKPLFDNCDTEALAGVLAHELSHAIRRISYGYAETEVDRFASTLVGSGPVRKALDCVAEGRERYAEEYPEANEALGDLESQSDLQKRLHALLPENSPP